jgi:hypothetical protein
MSTSKPLYGTKTAITISLNSLANGSIAVSSVIDNSTTLYEDFLIEVVISGTVASNAFCEVRLLPSADGTNFATWANGISLGIVDLSSSSPQTAHFPVTGVLYKAPEYFEIAVINNTGAALSSSGNSASYQGINTQIV